MDDWIIESLTKRHERSDFGSGRAELDDFLKKYASQYARRRLGTTYVAVQSGQARVLGYYTLAPSQFLFDHAPPEIIKGLPKHPVPSFLVGRLAVDQTMQGKGLGKFLLLNAFRRCLRVAKEVSFRAIEVQAIDEQAAAFYLKFGFLRFPDDRNHLALLLEAVEEVFGD